MTFFAAIALMLLSPSQPAEAAASDPAPVESSATIIFYRKGSVVGAAIACPIRYQGDELVELGRSKAFEWKVAPGRYILENKTSSIEVSVEPGETRYVRCQIKPGFLSGRADLQIVDGTEYAKAEAEFEQAGD